jgi:hypothetical protein
MRWYDVAAMLIVIGIVVSGCSKNENPLSVSSSDMSGKLGGWVELKDVDGGVVSDAGGVNVTVEGTNYSATTASDGQWSIDALPAGTYVVTFSKSGYGTYKSIGHRHVGGGDSYLSPVTLGVMPNISIANFSVRSLDSVVSYVIRDSVRNRDDTIRTYLRHVEVKAGFSGDSTEGGRVKVYFGRNQNVSNMPGNYLFEMDATQYEDGNWRKLLLRVKSGDLAQYGITPGSTLYAVAYVVSYNSTQYFDPAANQWAFTSVSAPTSILSVVVP